MNQDRDSQGPVATPILAAPRPLFLVSSCTSDLARHLDSQLASLKDANRPVIGGEQALEV